MVNNFPQFAHLVASSFQSIVKEDAFVVGVDGDVLYQRYLSAFPEGTNPKFKERTEHDCSCCKNFIRHAGNVVSIDKDGSITSVWDKAAKSAPPPYDVVAAAMRDLVKDSRIADIFRVSEKEISFGAQTSRSLDKVTGRALTWDHFYTGEIPKSLRLKMPDQVRGDFRTTIQVFERGLIELQPHAIETVLSLIEANSLYRGAEHKESVVQFQKAQKIYTSKNPIERVSFVWTAARGPAARFRNTVIGTLVQDLSDGKDVEQAVSSFESKVAPQNYKRTTSLITPGMVKKAMETLQELDLESALERRFARIEDISVNDVLWVDGKMKSLMKGGIGDVLLQHAVTTNTTPVDEKRAENITLDAFIKDILPGATGMEVFLKGEHLGNLMSLTAPVHPEPKQLFRWTNDFAWSYGGNVTDSIKERVKKAGGNVTNAHLRVSLSWFNYDDLDLHIFEPRGRGVRTVMEHICFSNKVGWTGGILDVDMNAGSGKTREAVENISWSRLPPDGAYKIVVNNYTKRETNDVGFVVEVESEGKISHFAYNKAVRAQQDVHVATLHMKDGRVSKIEDGDPGITTSAISKEKWGLHTEQFVKVNAVTLSPNYWGDNCVGNKHTFFVLDGAKNDEATRGIYNEFLHPRLEQHRKVFEVIGDKTKCQPTEGQLSGLGFSSTKKDSVIIKVEQGKKQRLFNVQIGA